MLNEIKNIIRIKTDKTQRKTTYVVTKENAALLQYALTKVVESEEVIWDYFPYYKSYAVNTKLTLKERITIKKIFERYYVGELIYRAIGSFEDCYVIINEANNLTV